MMTTKLHIWFSRTSQQWVLLNRGNGNWKRYPKWHQAWQAAWDFVEVNRARS